MENNHLSTDEKISLNLKEVQYQRDCQGGASNSGLCQQLRKDIQALREKGRSVLETELLAPASDMGPENTVKTKPGEIIPCVGSSNGFCQVTDQVLVTDQGKEWQLVPASDEQAQIGKAQQQSIGAQADAALKQWTADAFDVGCGGFGVAATACQIYRAAGGANPISDAVPSTGEQVLWGATAILNGLGIYGSIEVGGAKVTSPKSQAPSGAIVDNEAGGFSYYDQFKKADGGWDWPKDLGFSGSPVENVLPVGTKLDRYGGPEGSFLSPQGVLFEQRVLAPGSMAGGYY